MIFLHFIQKKSTKKKKLRRIEICIDSNSLLSIDYFKHQRKLKNIGFEFVIEKKSIANTNHTLLVIHKTAKI